MTKLLDGPAAGVELQLRRSPTILRVVKDPDGVWDACDLLDDQPHPKESIFVYYRASQIFRGHVCCSPRSQSYYFSSADYRFVPQQPADEDVRSSGAWRRWVLDNIESLRALPEIVVGPSGTGES